MGHRHPVRGENMENTPNSEATSRKEPEFKKFAFTRIIVGIVLVVAVLWILGGVLGVIQRFKPGKTAEIAKIQKTETSSEQALPNTQHSASQTHSPEEQADNRLTVLNESAEGPAKSSAEEGQLPEQTGALTESIPEKTENQAHGAEGQASHPAAATAEPGKAGAEKPSAHGAAMQGAEQAVAREAAVEKRPGVALIDACIQPLNYELNERWWGWRPNDLLQVTDNVNQFQLGVLEATRRTFVTLAERVSRTGSTDAFNVSLEKAMNWIMIKPDRYWFPSAESAYNDALNELRSYKRKLEQGQASFYTRADNLIPLLSAFEDLLGSCDENLVKTEELDGSAVGYFKADDYFFYAKGVASTLLPILEAVSYDFGMIIENRHGTELLHHAIENCRRASQIDPWLITNADLSGILANHRANMAAPISHARYYLGILIRTLSL
jgi:hypothetical protein